MLNQAFLPVKELSIFCRHCQKVMPAQLERSIAGSGKVVDIESTFEYFCSKCHRTICYCGNDIIENNALPHDTIPEPREYSPTAHFLVGETISHSSFQEKGKVVGKDLGTPSRILVQFEKSGLRKLVENIITKTESTATAAKRSRH
jgi:hypothetical protein